MKSKLFPHQQEDALRMRRNFALLNWSAPGTGKTRTALAGIEQAGFFRGVIIGPPLSLHMWAEEIREELGADVSVLKSGSSPIRGDFVVTTYGLATGSQRNALMDFGAQGGACLVLDEAHALKSRDAKRTQAILGRGPHMRGGINDQFEAVWQLTGTPMTRYPDDYYTQLRPDYGAVLKDCGVESYEQFIDKFCWTEMRQFSPRSRPIKTVTGPKNPLGLIELLKKCDPVIRSLDDVAKYLPPLTQRTLMVESPALRKHAKAMPPPKELENGIRQNDPKLATYRRELGELKLEVAYDHIAEAASQGPVLVGVWFVQNGHKLRDKLNKTGLRAVFIGGETPDAQRQAAGAAFNAGDIDCIVGQMGAMNTSWNLQHASSHVIIVDDDFSPGVIQQFYSRVYRTGQQHHTQLDFIKADHPVDIAISNVRLKKEKLDNAVRTTLETKA